jgi:hypothetical protein
MGMGGLCIRHSSYGVSKSAALWPVVDRERGIAATCGEQRESSKRTMTGRGKAGWEADACCQICLGKLQFPAVGDWL